jgi:proteasome activator subunit 4
MRRELVRCLRTVSLLSVFSSDTTTTANIQSALKSMVTMEPDLILPSILERAVSALETLTETDRTIAIIKALGAVSVGMVSRSVYYPGAKHITPVLELLIPGIDLASSPYRWKYLQHITVLTERSYKELVHLFVGERHCPVY